MFYGEANTANDSKLDTLDALLAVHHNAEIIKYSSEKRCLLQIKNDDADYFVKVYPKKFLRNNRGEKIHSVGLELWKLAEKKHLNFVVPKPVRWDETTRSIWQEKLAGVPAIDESLKGKNCEIFYQIGSAIAAISDLKITPPRLFDRNEQLKDTCEYARKILSFAPLYQDSVLKVLNTLADAHANLPTKKLVPIHGDMHIDQWLIDGEQLGLLDFEDFSHGEPERDLASFVVQLEAEYGEKVPVNDLAKELIKGFCRCGKSVNQTIFNVYAAHKWLAKASKGDAKSAEKNIERARQCLEFF
jgi:Phosphotransferase enzyme family